MKGKYIPFLVLPLFVFLFLLVNPVGIRGQHAPEIPEIEGEWRDTGKCIATECDSTKGKMEQTWFVEECEMICPEVEFEASKNFGGDCREGANGCQFNNGGCGEGNNTETFGPIPVLYIESSKNPDFCKRPKANTLGLTEQWVIHAYYKNMKKRLPKEEVCEWVATEETQLVECDDATSFACPVEEEVPVEDDEEVLGEKDKVEVVLTETGASSNIFVYVIQALLTVSTLLSGIFFSKKHIM